MTDRVGKLDSGEVVDRTKTWLERAVIGLNLCPFAKQVHAKGQIRWVVSAASTTDALLDDLIAELNVLSASEPSRIDTTLLIHPDVLHDFVDYNDFLDVADAAIEQMGLLGEVQVASFHPDYRFADAELDDVTNCSNRSPYPMLHLLREASVERAVASVPDTSAIIERNKQTLRELGKSGWDALGS